MDLEKGKFQYAGLKFLYEMELIDDPQLVNNLKLNILDISGTIKDVEFLSSYNHRAMLIYIDVSWFGRKFLLKRIEAGILDRVKQLLPNFRFRVTADRKIMDLALEKVKSVLKGEPNENSKRTASTIVGGTNPDSRVAEPAPEAAGDKPELQAESNVLQDPQTKTEDQ